MAEDKDTDTGERRVPWRPIAKGLGVGSGLAGCASLIMWGISALVIEAAGGLYHYNTTKCVPFNGTAVNETIQDGDSRIACAEMYRQKRRMTLDAVLPAISLIVGALAFVAWRKGRQQQQSEEEATFGNEELQPVDYIQQGPPPEEVAKSLLQGRYTAMVTQERHRQQKCAML